MILTVGSSPAVFYSAVFSFASSRLYAAKHTRKMLSLSSLFRMSFFVVCVHKHALPCLEITDMEQPLSLIIPAEKQQVSRTKTRRSDVAVVHPLLH